MQKTAKKTAPLFTPAAVGQAAAVNATWMPSYQQVGISPYSWSVTDHATVQWQDTTSNATYSSADTVMSTEDYYSKQG